MAFTMQTVGHRQHEQHYFYIHTTLKYETAVGSGRDRPSGAVVTLSRPPYSKLYVIKLVQVIFLLNIPRLNLFSREVHLGVNKINVPCMDTFLPGMPHD